MGLAIASKVKHNKATQHTKDRCTCTCTLVYKCMCPIHVHVGALLSVCGWLDLNSVVRSLTNVIHGDSKLLLRQLLRNPVRRSVKTS